MFASQPPLKSIIGIALQHGLILVKQVEHNLPRCACLTGNRRLRPDCPVFALGQLETSLVMHTTAEIEFPEEVLASTQLSPVRLAERERGLL